MLNKLEDLYILLLMFLGILLFSIGIICFLIIISPIFMYLFLLFICEKIYKKISG